MVRLLTHFLRSVKIVITGDFNVRVSDTSGKDFCDIYSFKHLIKESTCYKNLIDPKCITNWSSSFQNSSVADTGLSNFHKITLTVLRSYFQKVQPKIVKLGLKKNSNNESRSIINPKMEIFTEF